jgi:hypothetical protein
MVRRIPVECFFFALVFFEGVGRGGRKGGCPALNQLSDSSIPFVSLSYLGEEEGDLACCGVENLKERRLGPRELLAASNPDFT